MINELRKVSIVLLREDDSILLAMKKRGFGSGLWNGAGGKTEGNETIEEAAIRECQEEINVTPLNLDRVAIINFYSVNALDNQQAHVYFCNEWSGTPLESEEMKPEWFSLDSIPYKQMWDDDSYWLPRVLNGEKIEADFYFDANSKITKHSINPMAQ